MANMEESSSLLPRRHFNGDLLIFSKQHVYYDVNMFFEMATVQSRLNRNNDFLRALSLINTGLTESFALHLRNILVFFYNDAPTQLDVVASDFCSEGTWHEVRPSLTRTLSIARQRANKMLLHLTLERNSQEGPENPWNFDELAAEVKLLILVFVKTARPDCLAPNVALAFK
jgi:hypothetical protein